MEAINQNSEHYQYALRKVKKIKGFYIHLFVYIIINILIVIFNFQNLKIGESYFKPENFITAFFWGIGIISHAASVFGKDLIFNKNWEEKKIKEFMSQEKKSSWE